MYSGEIIYIFYVQELTGNLEYIQNDWASIGNKRKGQILNIYNVQLFHICDQFLVA